MISLPPLLPLSGFQLALPRGVRFGWGVRGELGRVASAIGRRAWLITGSRTLESSGLVGELEDHLRASGLETHRLSTTTREPLVEDVDRTVADLLAHQPGEGDLLIAVGGGSAIDLAKAVAALATNRQGESVRDYLEGVGQGLTINHPPLPLIAIPTTAGTGSEATRNAVISSLDPPFKKSLRSERMLPAAVLLDPELTLSCPPHVTAHSGMDAITQLIESLLSRRANAFTSALCEEGLRRALPALPIAVTHGNDREAREAMLYASFLSGVALANSGLGLAHGVAAALGVHCQIPHGLACAVLLPSAMRFNRDVRQAELAGIGRMFPEGAGVAENDAAAQVAIDGIEALCRRVGIPSTLTEPGVSRDQIETLVPASRGNSLSGNPRDVTDADLRQILEDLCR